MVTKSNIEIGEHVTHGRHMAFLIAFNSTTGARVGSALGNGPGRGVGIRGNREGEGAGVVV